MDFTVNYKFSADMKKFSSSLDKADGDIRRLDGQMRGLDNRMTRLSRVRPFKGISASQFKTIGSGFNRLGTIVNNVAKKMLMLTTVAGGAIVKLTKIGITFEKNFANVAKVLDDGTAQMNTRLMALREELMQLTKTLPIPAENLLNIAAVAGQMGIAVENVKDFTEWMAKLTITTNITADAGTELVSKFFNNMNLAPNTKNLKEFSNVITALGNNMAGREAGILKIAQMISQQANLLKISVKDTLALASSFNALNIRPEVARTFFQKTTDAIDEMVAHGGAELSKFTKMMGTTNSKFKSLWKDDPFQGYVAFVKRFSKMTNTEISDTYKKFFNSNIRNIATIKQVANAYRQLELAQEIANKATGNTIAINNELARRFDTVASKMILVRNNFEAVSTHIYRIFEPTIKRSLDRTINLLDKFDKTIQKNTINIKLYVENFGKGFLEGASLYKKGIDLALGALKKWVGAQSEAKRISFEMVGEDVIKNIGKMVALIPMIFLLSKALRGIGLAFQFIGGMVSLVGGGPAGIIIGLIALFGGAITVSEKLQGKLKSLFGWIAENKEGIANWFKEAGEALAPIGKVIEDILDDIIQFILDHKEDIINFFKEVLQFLQIMGPLLAFLLEATWEALKNLGPVIQRVIDAFNWLSEVIIGIVNWFGELIDALTDSEHGMEKLPGVFKKAWDGIRKYTWKAIQGIVSMFIKIPDKFKEEFDKLPQIVETALTSIPGIVSKFLGNLPGAVISTLLGGGKKPAKLSFEGVTEVIHTIRHEPFNPGVFTDLGHDSTNNYIFNVQTQTATTASDLAKIKQKKGIVTD